MKVTTVGIDLAKNIFQLHGVDEHGKVVIKKQLRREQMAEFFVKLPACLVGMEACGSAHHWVRKLQEFGHTVKLIKWEIPRLCRGGSRRLTYTEVSIAETTNREPPSKRKEKLDGQDREPKSHEMGVQRN